VKGRRNPFVAVEGIPFLLLAAATLAFSLRYLDLGFAAVSVAALFLLYLVFRDPRRDVPAAPLGVVSPVDGHVMSVDLTDKGVLQGEAHVIRIRIDALGTYTARAPIEGKIMDLRSVGDERLADYRTNALWIRTDEGDDVVLQFSGYRLGLAPKSIIGYGERVGQGQRCAYLRLTRHAEVHLPVAAKILVSPGDDVIAGAGLIGKVPHP
jgi:phosphatidylserine decarboxylase